jgi:hypothetical protein
LSEICNNLLQLQKRQPVERMAKGDTAENGRTVSETRGNGQGMNGKELGKCWIKGKKFQFYKISRF